MKKLRWTVAKGGGKLDKFAPFQLSTSLNDGKIKLSKLSHRAAFVSTVTLSGSKLKTAPPQATCVMCPTLSPQLTVIPNVPNVTSWTQKYPASCMVRSARRGPQQERFPLPPHSPLTVRILSLCSNAAKAHRNEPGARSMNKSRNGQCVPPPLVARRLTSHRGRSATTTSLCFSLPAP